MSIHQSGRAASTGPIFGPSMLSARVPFSSFRLILHFISDFIQSATLSLHVSSIDRPSQGVKTLKNYYDTRLINFIIGRP